MNLRLLAQVICMLLVEQFYQIQLKYFFGPKRVYVHYDNKTGIYDQTTIDVLQYISIENINIPLLMPETANFYLFYKFKYIQLSFVTICLNTRPVS